jgi:T5SS/PEP-CTERM-associated repeat protein
LDGGATTSGVTGVVVGNTATGALAVLGGSTLSYSGDSSIASASGSVGAVTVSGTNSLWSMSGNLYVSGSSSGPGGTGSLVVASGGTVYVGGTFEAYSGSTLDVESGATFSTSGIVAPGQITSRRCLIVWGKNDQIFPAAGAEPYKRDLKAVEFHLLDAGHFALESDGDLIARLMRDFLGRHVAAMDHARTRR